MRFADQRLARRVEGAWALSCVESARAHARRLPGSGVALEPIAGGHAVFLGAGSALSQAQGLGLDGPVDAADLARVEAFYKARRVPVQLEVCTLADPSLWALLGERRYRPSEPSHVLVRQVDPGAAWEPPPAPLELRTVAPPEAAVFAETVLGAFFEGADTAPRDLFEALVTSVHVRSAACWLARVSGEPAGAATSFVIDRVALFAGDGVLPRFRGRGVHDALLRARLAHAARHGCDLAVTATQPGSGSQRNAERLGFRIAYARLLFLHDWAAGRTRALSRRGRDTS